MEFTLVSAIRNKIRKIITGVEERYEEGKCDADTSKLPLALKKV